MNTPLPTHVPLPGVRTLPCARAASGERVCSTHSSWDPGACQGLVRGARGSWCGREACKTRGALSWPSCEGTWLHEHTQSPCKQAPMPQCTQSQCKHTPMRTRSPCDAPVHPVLVQTLPYTCTALVQAQPSCEHGQEHPALVQTHSPAQAQPSCKHTPLHTPSPRANTALVQAHEMMPLCTQSSCKHKALVQTHAGAPLHPVLVQLHGHVHLHPAPVPAQHPHNCTQPSCKTTLMPQHPQPSCKPPPLHKRTQSSCKQPPCYCPRPCCKPLPCPSAAGAPGTHPPGSGPWTRSW